MPSEDEVGNVRSGHKFTGVNYDDYFKNIVENEGKECKIYPCRMDYNPIEDKNVINCCLHDFEQSKKRIHRIGQKQTCFYYLMLCRGSIEERILKTLEERKDFTDELFEEC